MASTRPLDLSRRSLLLGLGGAAVLVACGTSSDTADTAGSVTPTTTGPALYLNPRFDQSAYAVTGAEQRLVMSIVDGKGETPKDLPATVTFVATRDGQAVGAPIVTAAQKDGVPITYFPIRFTPDQPGTYTMAAQLTAGAPSTTFVVTAADKSRLVAVGQKLPVTDTPTTDAPRGVTPICTRQGKDGADPCPLHSLNLRDALATGKPIALLISTPQFCQIGVCGPVLQLLLEQQGNYPDVQFIHAEVYKDPDSGNQETALVIDAFGMNYEPALYLASADGTVVERLDNVFDRVEIRAGLDRLKA